MVAQFLIIAHQPTWPTVGRQHQIQIAIAVIIQGGTTPAHHRLEQSGIIASLFNPFKHPRLCTRVPKKARCLRKSLARLHQTNVRLQVPIAQQQIKPTIQIKIQQTGPKLHRHPRARTGQPHRQGTVGKSRWRARIVNRQKSHRLIGKVRHKDCTFTRQILAKLNPHPRSSLPLRISCPLGEPLLNKLPPLATNNRRIGLVVEEKIPHRVIGHHQVGPTIVIRVKRHHTQRLGHITLAGLGSNTLILQHPHSRYLAGIDKFPSPSVAEQPTLRSLK